jgi:hypothetical protein
MLTRVGVVTVLISQGGVGCNMARPFYPHEADDPDLDWLVSNFLYERPHYIPVESGMLPLLLIPYHETAKDLEEADVIEKEPPVKEKRDVR